MHEQTNPATANELPALPAPVLPAGFFAMFRGGRLGGIQGAAGAAYDAAHKATRREGGDRAGLGT